MALVARVRRLLLVLGAELRPRDAVGIRALLRRAICDVDRATIDVDALLVFEYAEGIGPARGTTRIDRVTSDVWSGDAAMEALRASPLVPARRAPRALTFLAPVRVDLGNGVRVCKLPVEHRAEVDGFPRPAVVCGVRRGLSFRGHQLGNAFRTCLSAHAAQQRVSSSD